MKWRRTFSYLIENILLNLIKDPAIKRLSQLKEVNGSYLWSWMLARYWSCTYLCLKYECITWFSQSQSFPCQLKSLSARISSVTHEKLKSPHMVVKAVPWSLKCRVTFPKHSQAVFTEHWRAIISAFHAHVVQSELFIVLNVTYTRSHIRILNFKKPFVTLLLPWCSTVFSCIVSFEEINHRLIYE